MHTRERVSIIIPTYNYGHFINETLQSIKNQSFKDWECIIIDNGSTDNTRQIVEGWLKEDSRFKYKYIQHSTTSFSRNEGVKESKGEFIQFVDADDQIADGKLQNQVLIFDTDAKLDIVYSNAKYYDHGNPHELRLSSNAENKPWAIEFSGKTWDLLPTMFERNVFVISSPLLKRNVLTETEGFFNGLNWVEDWEFYFRCFAKNYSIQYDESQNSCSYIRVHPKSLSRNSAMMLEQSLIARRRVDKLILTLNGYEKAIELKNASARNVNYILKLLINEYAQNNIRKHAKYLFLFALRNRDYKLLAKLILSYFTGEKVLLELS